jgi:hypothetical protein
LKEQDRAKEFEAHIHPLGARPLVKSVYPYPLKGIVESFVSRNDERLLYTIALYAPSTCIWNFAVTIGRVWEKPLRKS